MTQQTRRMTRTKTAMVRLNDWELAALETALEAWRAGKPTDTPFAKRVEALRHKMAHTRTR